MVDDDALMILINKCNDQIWQWTYAIVSGGAYASDNELLALYMMILILIDSHSFFDSGDTFHDGHI